MGRPVPYAFLFSLPYLCVKIRHYTGYKHRLLRRLHALKDRPHLSDLIKIWVFLKTRATQPLATKTLQYVLQPREYVYNSICYSDGES